MPISAGLAGLSRLPGLTRLARGAAGTGCATGAALTWHPARPFPAAPAFATCAAFAVVTGRAVAAVAVITGRAVAARVGGCEASITGMHDGYAADGVAARGRSGARKG